MLSRFRKGFTLIELMVVIAIIGILVGLLVPALGMMRKKAMEAKCKSNLHQIYLALRIYADDYVARGEGEQFPARLTHLKMDSTKIFLCPFDDFKGTKGSRRDGQFPETYEPAAGEPETLPCSYFYEFCWKPCSWYSGSGIGSAPFLPAGSSWQAVKWKQLREGDDWLHAAYPGTKGYGGDLFPVVRCYWRQDKLNPANQDEDNKEKHVYNLSYNGSFFRSGMKWEWSSEQ
jgi:prepilin-type N-terminal cleavage/methylation domain-containing protein